MADRTSTIRMRVEGVQTVKSDLAQIESAVRRQTINLQRVAREAAQKIEGGAPGAAIAAAEAQSIARSVAGLQAIRNQTKQAIEENNRAVLEAGKSANLRKTALQQIAAQKEETTVARRYYLDEEMAYNKQAKFREDRAKQVRKEALMVIAAKKEEVAATKRLFLEEEAAYAQNAKKKETRARFAEKETRRTGLQQIAARKEEIAMQRRLFLDEEAAYRENERRSRARPGGRGEDGAGFLSGMGTKRILRQAVGFQAARIMSDVPGIGQSAGLIAGGFLYGGGMGLGALMSGVVVLGETIKGIVDAHKSAQQAVKEFSDNLFSLSRQLSSLAQGNALTTSFGSAASQMAAAASESQVKVAERYSALTTMSVGKALGWATERIYRPEERTGPGLEMQVIAQETALNEMVYRDAQRASEQEAKMAEADDRRNTANRRMLARAQAMPEGRNARWAILGAQTKSETDALSQAHRRQTAESKFAAEESSKVLHKLHEQLEETKKKGQRELIPGLEAKVTAAARASIEADKVVAALPEKQEMELRRMTFEQDARKTQMFHKDKREDDERAHVLELGKIALANEGWTAQKKILTEQYDFKISQAKAAGDSTLELEEDKRLKLAILAKEQRQVAGDTLRQLTNETALVNRTRLREDVELHELEIRLYRQWGKDATVEIEKVLDATRKFHAAKKAMALADMASQRNITLGMIHGTMSPYALQAEQFRKQHPELSEAEVREEITGRMKVDSAQFVKAERMRVNPLLQYKEYEKQMQQAVDTGEVTYAEAQKRLMARTGELAGPRVAGQFMDAMSYVRSVQSAISGEASIPKETRDAILELNRKWDDFMRMGVKIYG